MAGSVNLVVLIGNLGQDPEIAGGKNGKVPKLSIATSESWRDKTTGERKEETNWHRVTVFNPTAVEFAEKYLKKGNKIYVEGKQKTRKYEKHGTTHYSTEVVLGFGSRLENLTPSSSAHGVPSESDYGTTRTSGAETQSNASGGSIGGYSTDPEEDIPF
jgi:single-strand DNA-binding protein